MRFKTAIISFTLTALQAFFIPASAGTPGSAGAVAQFSIEPRVRIIKKPADPHAILEEAKKLLEA